MSLLVQIAMTPAAEGSSSDSTVFWFGLLVVAVLIGGLLYVLGSKDRYQSMTEEEFEQEARKKSMLGAAITGLEGALRKREATVLMEAKGRVERDATPAPGDPPEEADQNGKPKP